MSATILSPAAGSAVDYRRARALSRGQRAAAWGAVAAVHVGLVGGLALASLKPKPRPPTPTIMVSMISETASPSVAPQPPPPQPQPQQPTPQPKMVAAARPTASPMTAPPPEEPVRPAPPQAAATAPAPAAAPSAAATGPSITPPNFTAAYLNNPGPQYPYASRRKREQGVVKLHVLVNANGRPEKVEVQRSSGFPLLDQAAHDIVKNRWRFAPAKQGDKAVSAWVVVPLEFELKER